MLTFEIMYVFITIMNKDYFRHFPFYLNCISQVNTTTAIKRAPTPATNPINNEAPMIIPISVRNPISLFPPNLFLYRLFVIHLVEIEA